MKWAHQIEILGGHLDLLEAKGRIEVKWSHRNVVDSGELDVTDHGCEGNECAIKTNMQHQGRGPGGSEGDQKATGAVERN